MASSSLDGTKYDVFVSFRGEDTRYKFISHLVAAFGRKQIKTFVDYRLTRGDEISPSLMTAIEGSDISVVVFSERYASSRWCLDELVKILECKKKYGQIVLPVFYLVDPSHVRKQESIFGESFSKLKERFQDKLDKLESWETALKETANLSGFPVEDDRPESEIIEEIVGNVLRMLNKKHGICPMDRLIGVNSTINDLKTKLSSASTSVYTLGIYGIGGIGKTAIATAILKDMFNSFQGSSLIENIRESYEERKVDQLKQKLFSDLLKDENEKIDHSRGFNFDFIRLKRKKVMVVFDDVTNFDQIKSLVGSLDSFGDGSRILITTRDRKVLDEVNKVNAKYEMKELLPNDALTLFSQLAFQQNQPIIGFRDLSEEIIKYASGVPLALKVLGSFLSGRQTEEWESEIEKLKKIPNPDIQKVLKISYDGLDYEEKYIFLDIACFFKRRTKHETIELLNARGFSAKIAMTVLEEKCLIIISDHRITMHDLIEEMGKDIVRQESIDNPGKRSRLWQPDDIYKVLAYKRGSEAIQSISFNMSKVKKTHFKLSTFKKMPKLKFLEFYGQDNCKASHYREEAVFFELIILHWNGYPCKSLARHLHPEYLCSIELHRSKIKKLWDGNQDLRNLKRLDLSYSRQLKKLPDLKNASNLKYLILYYCTSLKSLPPKIDSKSLNYFILDGCTKLMRFPDFSSCKIDSLYLHFTGIEELSSIECLSRLRNLTISDFPRLKQLPTSMCKLKSLEEFRLSDCPNLQLLPESLGQLFSLKQLFLSDLSNLQRLPHTIGNLKCLWSLEVTSSAIITELPESLGQLFSLGVLRLVDLSNLQRLPDAVGNLKCLESLEVESSAIIEVPSSIVHLHRLRTLRLRNCKNLQFLPKLSENLEVLDASNCMSLQALPSDFSIFLAKQALSVQFLEFDWGNCFQLDQKELSEIVKKVLQSIRRGATKWLNEAEIKDLKYYKPCWERFYGSIRYPGSEIPDWFDFRGMESSGSVRLQRCLLQNNLIGFVVCAVVTFANTEYSESSKFELCCAWKCANSEDPDGPSSYFGSDRPFPFFLLDGAFGFTVSDELPLRCEMHYKIFENGFLESLYNDEVFIRFSTVRADVNVKKWGVHFLYCNDE